MEDALITFETAKLAKEKEFDIKTTHYYLVDEKKHILNISKEYSIEGLNWNVRSTRISAPTQSLLAKWFREKHNIHLIAYKNINIDGYDWCYITTDGITNINSYKTYEEALEAGLQEALKLIK